MRREVTPPLLRMREICRGSRSRHLPAVTQFGRRREMHACWSFRFHRTHPSEILHQILPIA